MNQENESFLNSCRKPNLNDPGAPEYGDGRPWSSFGKDIYLERYWERLDALWQKINPTMSDNAPINKTNTQ